MAAQKFPRPWKYNPSSWNQRARIAIVAAFGTLISVYMGLFQWGLVPGVWDPLFGKQTEHVLLSNVSHWMISIFHLPDAVLGAIAYLGDSIFGLAGSTRRWQYRPWLVILFGLDVIPLGIVGIILVIMQGFVVHAWCFLCLLSAAISLFLIILAYDEVFSSILYLYETWRLSKRFKTVWLAFCGIPSKSAYDAGENMLKKRRKKCGLE